MDRLILYTTVGCHLCERAENLLQEFRLVTANSLQFELEAVDISCNAALVEQYGIRIPVVKNPVTDKEISWPFGVQELFTLF